MPDLGRLSPLFPQITPERAVQVLTEQLQAIEKLRGREYKEAEEDEALWERITEASIEAAFGQSTEETRKFVYAKTAGSYSLAQNDAYATSGNF